VACEESRPHRVRTRVSYLSLITSLAASPWPKGRAPNGARSPPYFPPAWRSWVGVLCEGLPGMGQCLCAISRWAS
jgi:hypothetical protein